MKLKVFKRIDFFPLMILDPLQNGIDLYLVTNNMCQREHFIFFVNKRNKELEISEKIYAFTLKCTIIHQCPHVTTKHYQHQYRAVRKEANSTKDKKM